MQLDRFAAKDSHLNNLLHQSQYWQRLNMQIKRLLPENLHSHFCAVCIQDNDLILHVTSPMAATRLKMLLPMLLPQMRQYDNRIGDIVVKTRPRDEAAPREKNFRISARALDYFEQTAQQLAHHPELAHAMHNLVKNNR